MSRPAEYIDGHRCLTAQSKSDLLREIALTLHLRVFVETGTACGDSCLPMLEVCDEVHSCDVNLAAIEHTRKRLGATDPKLHLYNVDARTMLHDVMVVTWEQPALIWLDAHFLPRDFRYANEICPLRDELRSLFERRLHPKTVVLIDDVRLFANGGGYPSIDEIRDIAKGWHVQVKDDIVRISKEPLPCE